MKNKKTAKKTQRPAPSARQAAARDAEIISAPGGWRCSLLAFFASASAVLIAFSLANRMLFSTYTVMEGDYFSEMIPFYIETLRKIFRNGDLLGNGNFWYSFEYSMGSDICSQYNFYSCFTPFVLFYLIPNANAASICMLTGKLATAGCFFQIFCRKCLKKDGLATVAFSAAYALCGYCCVFYLNAAFLEGVYMLPLILCLIRRLIDERKWIGLSFGYAYLFINCFYEGYLVGIFSFLVFALALILLLDGSRCEKWKTFGLFAASAGFAAALSSFILLPSAVYILSNIAEDATSFQGLELNFLDILGNLFLGMNQGRDGVIPYLYCGLFTLFAVPYFFAAKSVPRRYKLFAGSLLGFLLLCCLVSPLYLFMHCFDNPDTSGFRFAYMISFLLLAISVFVYDQCRENITKKAVLVTAACWTGILLLVYFLQQETWDAQYQSLTAFLLELNLLLLACHAAYLLKQGKFRGQKNSRTFFPAFCYLEILFNAYLVLIMVSYTTSEHLESYELMTAQNEAVFAEISEAEGDTFYRSTMDQSISPNLLMLYGQKGTDYFSSFENLALRDTMTKLGYATSARIVFDYGGTDFTRMIFAQKYKVVSYSVPYNNFVTEPYYEVQEQCLGLGFLCTDGLYDAALTGTAPENQNILLSAMTGLDDTLYKEVSGEIGCAMTGIDYSYGEWGGDAASNAYVLQEGSESGEVTYTFRGEDGVQYYCYLPSSETGYHSNYPLIYSDGGDIGYDLTSSFTSLPHMLALGRDENGDCNVKLYIDDTMRINYIQADGLQFLYQDDAVLEQAYSILSERQMNIEEYADGYVKGTVSATEEYPVLFLSIPYEKGWKAYVDGEEAQIIPAVNGTFLSLSLEAGEHSITLLYSNGYGKIGTWVSLASLLAVIVLGICGRKIPGGKKQDAGAI